MTNHRIASVLGSVTGRDGIYLRLPKIADDPQPSISIAATTRKTICWSSSFSAFRLDLPLLSCHCGNDKRSRH